MLDSTNDADRVQTHSFIEKDLCAKSLGIRFEPTAPGRTCARMVVRPDMVNAHGTCHGGMIFALADAVFAVACNSRGRRAVAQFCSIAYMRAARVGDELTAVGVETVQAGQRGVCDITISCGDAVVAAFRGHSRSVEASAAT
jgi:phenylacetic acid degradation protein PaaD